MPRVVLPEAGEQHVPIRLWGRVVPAGALEQLKRVAAQPYVVEHVAAMPDLHVANGVAVGTVFATTDTVVPAALGGDLGCGMSAVRFDYPAAQLSASTLGQLLEALGRHIPVGDFTHRGKGQPVPDELLATPLSTGALDHTRARLAPKHLGTLGGGNHFIELDRDGGGDLWLLVHTGSRGLGSAIAAHHLRAADEGAYGDIPGLRCDTEEGQACLADIEWALSFARANRDALMGRAAQALTDLTGREPDPASRVDVHHNFVRFEEHFGRRLLVHRKGAIAAPAGEWALIPGSMGTASYIVEGHGEPQSFRSASHGAGRVMTRREAREQIRPERFAQSMRRVVFDQRRRASMVEEAPSAYRDIGEVLEDEADLVRPVVRLEPIAVLKG
jgi:tRNA-splicing ligase RtcB (3'-phosphate/5'-hydroxy nucleic acid ligase)